MEVVNPVVAHVGRDRLIRNAEAAAKTAALVGAVDLDQFELRDLREQVAGLREVGLIHLLRRPRVAQAPDRRATFVQADLVWELGPREDRRFQVVVDELDELARRGPDLRNPGVGSIASKRNRT